MLEQDIGVAQSGTVGKDNLFSTVFYKSPLMMIITEAATGNIVDVNEQFVKFLGYSKEELMGRTLSGMNIMINPDDRKAIASHVNKNTIKYDHEIQERTKSGEMKRVSVSVNMVNINGMDCFLGIGIDVTKKKNYENHLKKVNTGAEVAIYGMHGFDMVKAMDIVRCEADGNYTKIFLSCGKQIVSTQNLKQYSDQWHGNLFYRTHRKHLVNVSHIVRYHKGSNGIVIMSNGSPVPVARNEKCELVSYLSGKSKTT